MPVLPGSPHLTRLIPRRQCALCQAPRDVLHMTLAGRLWVCCDCLASGRAVAPEPSRTTRSERELSWEESAALLAKFDATVRYGGLLLRAASYGILVVLAYRSPLWASVLTGVFCADFAIRMISGAFQIRDQPVPFIAEVILFAAVGQFWVGGAGTLLPADAEGRAIAMLGFMGVFSVRISVFVWKLMHNR